MPSALFFGMSLPINSPFAPMEALSVEAIPEGDEWQYEPKWDGFRGLAFRDGSKVEIQSKSGQSLTRYFPEIVDHLKASKARRFVLDGEIVIPAGNHLSFDDLLQRIHPAASRVTKLSKEHPAWFITFDLLVDENGNSLVKEALEKRRPKLERFWTRYFKDSETVRISPATQKIAAARKWFKGSGPSLDGIIAKRLDLPYESGNREGMQKIKRIRTVDCVVGGFRYAEKKPVVGSLLLGLYDDDGLLHHVGFTSGLKSTERPALTKALEALVQPPGFTGRAPGGPSRWSTARSAEWKPLKPHLVVEVSYDHFSADRFRHGTRLLRWRPDKSPRQCLMDQVLEKKSKSVTLLFRKRK